MDIWRFFGITGNDEPEYTAEVQDGYDYYTLSGDSIEELATEISDYLEKAPVFEQDIIIDVTKNS